MRGSFAVIGLIPDPILSSASRLGAAAQNAFEVARFGGLETDEEPSPFEVVAERAGLPAAPLLRRRGGRAPPVLLVPPLMLAADVYDVSPASSAVSVLHADGADPWVVDFGAPEREEGGLERDLADHVVAVSEAIDRVREATGARRPPRRLLAGRDVLLPGGRLPPRRGDRHA